MLGKFLIKSVPFATRARRTGRRSTRAEAGSRRRCAEGRITVLIVLIRPAVYVNLSNTTLAEQHQHQSYTLHIYILYIYIYIYKGSPGHDVGEPFVAVDTLARSLRSTIVAGTLKKDYRYGGGERERKNNRRNVCRTGGYGSCYGRRTRFSVRFYPRTRSIVFRSTARIVSQRGGGGAEKQIHVNRRHRGDLRSLTIKY